MLTLISVAVLIYRSMLLYAFGKVWVSSPHSWGLKGFNFVISDYLAGIDDRLTAISVPDFLRRIDKKYP